MKKLIALSLCVTLSLSALTGCGSSAQKEAVDDESANEAAAEETEGNEETTGTDETNSLEGAHFVVGLSPTYSNFETVAIQPDGTKEYEGLDIDVLNALAQKCGFTYEISSMNHASLITAIQESQIDFAISAIRATEEEEKYVDFSDSYMTLSEKYSLLFRTEDHFTSAEDLYGKTISCVDGEDYELKVPAIQDAVLTTYGNGNATVEALLAGETDAVMTDKETCEALCSENSDLSYLTIDSAELGAESYEYAIAFPKDCEYLDDINTALQELKDAGIIDIIIDEWFGTENAE